MKIYAITEYNLIGAKFKSHHLVDEIKDVKQIVYTADKQHIKYVWGYSDGVLQRWDSTNYYYISDNPHGYDYNDGLLPFWADVTEDLPAGMIHRGIEPKKWYNCQLMTEKHGGYLQFKHHQTGEILRIAMNSNFYEPVDIKAIKNARK